MLELVRRTNPQLVWNPQPSGHVAIGVGNQRFDRGGADVDADCGVFT
ncbi:hypothetical protein I551_1397 [Mycobacterium ulcerans str. Harvey]|uniref:Uncharacterized protein n=1 Tax=Mycobacterium ulcerans str. Harvey TaxID=1299332 RepID=A0ABP3AQA8_MYCUL|nr:hypothetical protein I551_1397 [Mycobacterium ulcerans str. Harvey]